MVYVNNKKFACESCIKGHRSSSCHHTDRPLFEIKKKGRPVSQCDKCRELRQSKKVHSKCTCNPKSDSAMKGQVNLVSGQKSRRFIPIVPALPNGLKDVLRISEPSLSRQKVDSLLNPCNCKDLWKCQCNRSQSTATDTGQPNCEDLNALADAAVMQCCQPSTSVIPFGGNENPKKHYSSRSPSPTQLSYKRIKSSTKMSANASTSFSTLRSGPELPPIYNVNEYTLGSDLVFSDSDFDTMPPMSTIRSLAGTGCTCGVLCACPGCAEHRTSKAESNGLRVTKLKDCADGCAQCIDHTLRALPGSEPNYTSPIDMFFATMAAIPPPPTMRGPGGASLVKLPKLECCGGLCGCPNGNCSCNTACDGCCLEEERGSSLQASLSVVAAPPQMTHRKRSCCATTADPLCL